MKKSTIIVLIAIYTVVAIASITLNWWFIATYGWLVWAATQAGIIIGQLLLCKWEAFQNWYVGGIEKSFNLIEKISRL